jgi:hypothetical protein
MAALQLMIISQIYKNPSFSEEMEWRIIHSLFIPNAIIYEKNKSLSDIKFRPANNKIITYHEYNLDDKFNSKLIPEIVLGPKSKIDIPELELFLKANGLVNTKVIQSKSTYR